jgi:hypothetical protein
MRWHHSQRFAAAPCMIPVAPPPPRALPGGRPAAEGVPRLVPRLPPGRHLVLPQGVGPGLAAGQPAGHARNRWEAPPKLQHAAPACPPASQSQCCGRCRCCLLAFLNTAPDGARAPPPPPHTHTPDVAHLRDPAFLVKALRYRAARLLHTLAARLRKHSRRMGDFKAWSKCLLHVLVRGGLVLSGVGCCGGWTLAPGGTAVAAPRPAFPPPPAHRPASPPHVVHPRLCPGPTLRA